MADEKEIQIKISELEKKLHEANVSLANENKAKNKIFSSLVKLAKELKETKAESDILKEAATFANRAWYEGGLWREPQLLPSALRTDDTANNLVSNQEIMRAEPVSLTDLFLDLVIVVAFSRVGNSIEERGSIEWENVTFFAIFWLMWIKEASYSTRFDTSDLSSQIVTLLTCFAVLFGSLSSANSLVSEDATRIMMMAAFVALLHFLLHWRVASLYRFSQEDSEGYLAKQYAIFVMLMCFFECVVWISGIFLLSTDYRWLVFLFGIVFSLRVPKAFLANDFHAACSKRGVLFILLLGFLLQSVVVVASPFFDQMSPNTPQYVYFGCACLLLFCIKLIYVTDTDSSDERENAILVSRVAGFFFHLSQFCLLFSTTVFGAGLDLTTHSYLARISALPNNAKKLVCGGFAAVLVSILFIKSMHIRRIPKIVAHVKIFRIAYSLQIFVHLAIISLTAWMCYDDHGHLAFLMENEVVLIIVLSICALLLVMVSWLDEAIELSLYGNTDPMNFSIQPFGIWYCLQPQDYDDIQPPTLQLHNAAPPDVSPLLQGRSLASVYHSLGLSSSSLKSTFQSSSKLDESA